MVAAAWLGGLRIALDGEYALPLERPYILLAEARDLAAGTLPPANDGLLWQALLVPGAKLAGGAHAHLWVGLLTALILAATAAVTFDLGRRIGGNRLGSVAAALALANGWLLYESLAGTEVALAALALVAAADAAVAGALWPLGVAMVALALAAPWGAGVALAAVAAAAAPAVRTRRSAVAAPLGLAVLASLYVLLQGGIAVLVEPEPAASALRRAGVPVTGKLAAWFGDASSAASSVAVTDPRFLVPVAELALAGIGVGLLWRASRVAAVLAVAAGILALLASGTAGWPLDNGRILAPLVPLLAAAAAWGLSALPPPAQLAAGVPLVVVAALPLAGWWGDAAVGASQLSRVQLPFARESAAAMAPGSRVAVDRPGAFTFLASQTLDLSGRDSPELRPAAGEGLGAVWESLERLPEAGRPDLFAVSLDRLTPLGQTGLLGRAFIERRIPYEERPEPDTVHVLTLYAANWEAVGRAETPPDGLGVRVDGRGVDVGDLAGERAARYRARWNLPVPDRSVEVPLVTLPVTPGAAERVSEGCRLVVDERFEVETRQAGASLLGRVRGRAALDLVVDGRRAGTLGSDGPGDAFGYVRAGLGVPAGRHVVELRSRDETAYVSCRYWVVR